MQPQAQPTQPSQGQAPMGQETEFDDGIMAGLEEHLNTLSPEHQTYLTQAISKDPETIINVLGLVCGPEVGQYFSDIYNQFIAPAKQNSPQPNSAPSPKPAMAANSGPINPAPTQPNKQQATQAPIMG